jgi:hypothetical protein
MTTLFNIVILVCAVMALAVVGVFLFALIVDTVRGGRS